jgi:hypothetical protein
MQKAKKRKGSDSRQNEIYQSINKNSNYSSLSMNGSGDAAHTMASC